MVKLFDKKININDISEIKLENKVDFIKRIIKFSNDDKKIGSTVEELVKITKDDQANFKDLKDFNDVFDFIRNSEKKTKLVLEKIKHDNEKLYNDIVNDYSIIDNNKYMQRIMDNITKKRMFF